jgi:hypothetical protein
MSRKPKVQTRLPKDTHERFEEYREARDLTKSDATRRLVEAGLDVETDRDNTEMRTFEHVATFETLWRGGVVLGLLVLLLAEVGL